MIIAAIAVLAVASAAEAKSTRAPLPRGVEQEILSVIDDTCGDTWCEGDYNYRFTHFNLENGSATLEFFFFSNYDKPKPVAGKGFAANVLSAKKAVCRVPAKSLADVYTRGKLSLLTDSFYNNINDCINKLTLK